MTERIGIYTDEQFQAHLAGCVECWENLVEMEERHGIDLRLPERPEFTTDAARDDHLRTKRDSAPPRVDPREPSKSVVSGRHLRGDAS